MSALTSFARLWQQEEFSDVDVLLTAPCPSPTDSSTAAAGSDTEVAQQTFVLTTFPGHNALLSTSAYLKAQVLRWQRKRPLEDSPTLAAVPEAAQQADSTQAEAAGSKHAQQDSRPQLVLALQDASEQQAAMAVLEALYATKPLPELLSELTQEQQLQAALLADIWQVPGVSTAAAAKLLNDHEGIEGLSAEVEEQLLRSPAVPDCLREVVKEVVLSKFTDLEAVWADLLLREWLMDLSLPVMELLLSCNEGSSEDTVLFTAQAYADRIADPQQKQHVMQQLAPHIRCQDLSHAWLSASLLCDSAPDMVLVSLRPHVKKLLMSRVAQLDYRVEPEDLKNLLKGAPASWALKSRARKTVNSVQLTWQVQVRQIREAVESCAAQQQAVVLVSPQQTPPLGGLAFEGRIGVTPHKEGMTIDVLVCASKLPVDMYYSCTARVNVRP